LNLWNPKQAAKNNSPPTVHSQTNLINSLLAPVFLWGSHFNIPTISQVSLPGSTFSNQIQLIPESLLPGAGFSKQKSRYFQVKFANPSTNLR
jgi:hypothetical protein